MYYEFTSVHARKKDRRPGGTRKLALPGATSGFDKFKKKNLKARTRKSAAEPKGGGQMLKLNARTTNAINACVRRYCSPMSGCLLSLLTLT